MNLTQCWVGRVENELEGLQADRKEGVKQAWASNRELSQSQEMLGVKVTMDEATDIFEWKVSPGKGKKKKLEKAVLECGTVDINQNARSAVKQSLPIKYIEAVEKSPEQWHWTEINQNILKEDEKDPHVELNEWDQGSLFEKEIDNDMFLTLTRRLSCYEDADEDPNFITAPASNLETEWMAKSVMNSGLPRLKVFQSISLKFKEIVTTDALLLKYISLTKPQTSVPNIDCPEGDAAPPVTVDQAFDTFRELFCRRCLVYDCLKHNDFGVLKRVGSVAGVSRLPSPSLPCSAACYLHPSPGGAGSGASWTGGDITSFRVLAATFPDNWCKIALCMATKTCEQVHKFSAEDEQPRLEPEQESTSASRPKKRVSQSRLYKEHGETYTPGQTGAYRDNSVILLLVLGRFT